MTFGEAYNFADKIADEIIGGTREMREPKGLTCKCGHSDWHHRYYRDWACRECLECETFEPGDPEVAALTARVEELEQENAKLLDEVEARRFTDERTDKLLDELEAENKRLGEALEEIQGYGEVEVNPQHDWDVGNDLNAFVRIAREALANKAEALQHKL